MARTPWETPGPSSEPGAGKNPTRSGPARSPYSGTYKPAGLAMSKKQVVEGLKGLNIKHPNRHLTTTAYKTSLKKAAPGAEE